METRQGSDQVSFILGRSTVYMWQEAEKQEHLLPSDVCGDHPEAISSKLGYSHCTETEVREMLSNFAVLYRLI
uniref:Spire type actin nucleation factor 1 n=1 Tax=Molossus molossus TaxID=27622 RepID=A0A7J8HKL0_MOLMO|nr:spire type actin nucleation factor 1 [Molossus molossus]